MHCASFTKIPKYFGSYWRSDKSTLNGCHIINGVNVHLGITIILPLQSAFHLLVELIMVLLSYPISFYRQLLPDKLQRYRIKVYLDIYLYIIHTLLIHTL